MPSNQENPGGHWVFSLFKNKLPAALNGKRPSFSGNAGQQRPLLPHFLLPPLSLSPLYLESAQHYRSKDPPWEYHKSLRSSSESGQKRTWVAIEKPRPDQPREQPHQQATFDENGGARARSLCSTHSFDFSWRAVSRYAFPRTARINLAPALSPTPAVKLFGSDEALK